MLSQSQPPKRKIRKLSTISNSISNADGDTLEQKLDSDELELKRQYKEEYAPPLVEKIPEHVQSAWEVVQEYLYDRQDAIEKRLKFTSSDMFHSDGIDTAYGENGYAFLPVDVYPTLPKDMQEVVQDMYRANVKNIETVIGMKCDLVNCKIQPFDKLEQSVAMDEPCLYECLKQHSSIKGALNMK